MASNWVQRILFVFTAACMVASSVMAAGPPPADNNADTVLARVRPLAEQGNPNAQYNMGVIYDRGYGVERDYAKARKWYLKAAAQGNAKAAHNLGVMYHKGHGVPVNNERAVHWFKKAARLGEPAAQNNLAVMYASGMGVEKNLTLAAIWMARAAQAGNQSAIDNLSVIVAELPHAQIAGDNVNIRAEPGTQSDVLTQLDAGANVVVLQRRDGWARVLIAAQYTLGWVADSLLRGGVQLLAGGAAANTAAASGSQPGRAEAKAAMAEEPAAGGTEALASAATQAAADVPTDDGESAPQHGASVVKAVGVDIVNVREQPSRQAEVLFQLQRGTRVTVLKSRNGWNFVDAGDGRRGWVAGYLLIGG